MIGRGYQAVEIRLRDGTERRVGDVHPTRVQAKAAWARGMDPDLKGASDKFAATHFDQWARNQKSVKIVFSGA